ncbi:MAG: phage holin family protein [Muribaculaceae bacterium]|nr:phage holin family protein [Muribaculaceae bacterium]
MILKLEFILWLAMTYGCVLIAMAVDFCSGVRKARKAGIATRSRGYKMTCDKAVKYFLPMLCLSCIDTLASVFYPVPFLTMVMAAFNIFCELKSVLETTREKEEIRQATDIVKKVVESKDDIIKAITMAVLDNLAGVGDPPAQTSLNQTSRNPTIQKHTYHSFNHEKNQ